MRNLKRKASLTGVEQENKYNDIHLTPIINAQEVIEYFSPTGSINESLKRAENVLFAPVKIQ